MNNTAITTWISTVEATAIIKDKIARGIYKKGEIKKSSYRFTNGKDKTDGYICRVMVTVAPVAESEPEVKEEAPKAIVCPECGSVHFIKNGKDKDGTQKFKCKDCGKNFKA